jgi:hypothetical protein
MKINHIITEFVTPQATAQDPGLEREKDVDVIFFGFMPQDFTARTAWKALEDVLPREYPAGSERAQNKIAEVSKNNGAVVTTKPLSTAQKLVKEFQARGIKCRINAPGLEEGNVTKTNTGIVHRATDKYGAGDEPFNRHNPGKYVRDLTSLDKQQVKDLDDSMGITWKNHGTNGVAVDEESRPPIAPDPQDYDSDWDYYNDRDADDMTDSDPADDMTDDEPDDWVDESKEKVGNMDADAFDAALSRMKKLAGAGPLRTVYDPARRVYKNVPHAVQPAQQPKKVR